MFFSQTAEYALRAAVHLAGNTHQPLTNQELADATRVPAGYLAKVLQALGRARLVTSRRGLGGGFTLARDADEISILDVVNAVDPLLRIRDCPLGLEAHASQFCPLHRKLDDILAKVEAAFSTTSLADLLPGHCTQPLCQLQMPGNGAKQL